MRRGQTMLETALAVLFVTFVFLGLFQLSHMLTAKILLDHAAARAARAKAVGFNDFMCLKSARVATIPVAGKRLWPEEGGFVEASRVPIYMCTDNEALARGVLEYERWNAMRTSVGADGGLAATVDSSVRLAIPRFWSRKEDADSPIRLTGEAAIEAHFPFYMEDSGL